MLFVELPTEILANILQMLAYRDILSCREMCKLLQGIVDKCIAVSYALELGASGKLDNPLCTDSNAENLAELRSVNRRWAQFRWKHRVGPIPVRNFASVYEFTGGCFFQDINASYSNLHDSPPCSISWLPFPRPESIGVHVWGHSQFEFRPADICVDVNRDLMVVIERRESLYVLVSCFSHFTEVPVRSGLSRLISTSDGRTQSVTCIAHFRTISTNEKHPDAAVPLTCVSTTSDPLINDHSMIVQLGGDHLGLLLSRREIDFRRSDNIHLLDWTTGVRKANIMSKPGCRWDSFCFLSDDAILLPDSGSGELSIYLLTPEPDSLKHAISLQLPETKRKHAIHYISVRCEPVVRSPTAHYRTPLVPTSRQTPFRTDPQAAIVIIALDYALPTEGEGLEIDGFLISLPEPQVFAIKRKTLLDFARVADSRQRESYSYSEVATNEASSSSEPSVVQTSTTDSTMDSAVDSAVPQLPSKDWIHFTRWGLSPVPARWICYVHGSRYVSMPDRPWGSGRKMALKIYDFNIMEERKAECMGQDYLQEPLAGAQPEGWAEDDDEDEEVEFIPNEVGIATKISTPTKWPVKSVVTLLGPCKVNKPELFKEPFETSLPCRLIETEAVFDWDSVVIDEEHVVGLKEEHPESGILENIDVLVF